MCQFGHSTQICVDTLLNVAIKVFLMRLTFKLVEFEKSRLFSIAWVVLTQIVKNLLKKIALWGSGNSASSFQIWTTISFLLRVVSLLAHLTDFGFVSFHNHMNQLLKISLSLYASTYPIGSVSVENPD